MPGQHSSQTGTVLQVKREEEQATQPPTHGLSKPCGPEVALVVQAHYRHSPVDALVLIVVEGTTGE